MNLIKVIPVVEYYGVDTYGMSYGGKIDNPLSRQLTDHLDGDRRRFFIARVLPVDYRNHKSLRNDSKNQNIEIADDFQIGQKVILKTEKGEELEGTVVNIINKTTAKVTISKTGKTALVDITQVEPKGLKKFENYENTTKKQP